MKQYIISDPNILGGMPVIKGTRIPIERILFLIKEGYLLDDILEDYNHIDKETLEHVLDEITEMVRNIRHDKKTL